MKKYLPILSLIALIPLTACQTTREPAPGNELVGLISHKDFQNVATNHPEFAAHCIRKVTELEIELAWANHKKTEALRAIHRKAKQPIPPGPPAVMRHKPSRP